jgi:GrpB-like predicted nucleotidyltransferase (UPF0157 family)
MSQTDHVGDWEPAQEQRFREAWLEAPPRVEGVIHLAEYDPGWPHRYEQEATLIRAELGHQVVRVDHIGSTSVPGLAAKPKIDILLVVPDPVDEKAYIPGLERAGYRLVIREPDWHEHRLLRKGPHDDVNMHDDINMHVFGPDSPEIERYIRFRDHLRANGADRQLYEDAKRRLAGQRWAYIQQYADAKTDVVEEIMQRALTLKD